MNSRHSLDTLSGQVEQFDRVQRRELIRLHIMLQDRAFVDHVMVMARRRLEDGFPVFGRQMYDWTPEQRLLEVSEELADAIVYLTSGEV